MPRKQSTENKPSGNKPARNRTDRIPSQTDDNINTLSAIVRGMQHAVNTAQEMLDEYYTRLFEYYFDEDNNPKLVTLNIPPEYFVQAPLITLVPISTLCLEEMTIEMSIDVINTTPKKIATEARDKGLDRSSFDVSFAPKRRVEKRKEGSEDSLQREDTIDIVMKFKRGDPPEGVSRILDEFYKAVVKGKIEKEEK